MKNTRRRWKALAMRAWLALALAGCATPHTGVVDIGSGTYMLSKFGSFTTFSGGQVKADLYKEAAEFCRAKGRQVVPGSSTSKDSGLATYASAEVQFRCE